MASAVSTEIARALSSAVAGARSTGGTAQSSQTVVAEAVAEPVARAVASVFAYVFRGDVHSSSCMQTLVLVCKLPNLFHFFSPDNLFGCVFFFSVCMNPTLLPSYYRYYSTYDYSLFSNNSFFLKLATDQAISEAFAQADVIEGDGFVDVTGTSDTQSVGESEATASGDADANTEQVFDEETDEVCKSSKRKQQN